MREKEGSDEFFHNIGHVYQDNWGHFGGIEFLKKKKLWCIKDIYGVKNNTRWNFGWENIRPKALPII